MIVRAGRHGDDSAAARKDRLLRLGAILSEAGHEDAVTPEAMQFAEGSIAQRTVSRGIYPLVLEIVLELFPGCTEPEANDHESQRLRHEARIASPQHFDGYFRLDPPTGLLKQSELRAVFDELTGEVLSDAQATALASMGAALSVDLRSSLRQGLSDFARELSPEHANSLLRNLPIVARARADVLNSEENEPIFPWESIGTLLLRAASRVRGAADIGVQTAVVDAILDVVNGLPNDEGAEIANDFSHRPPPSLALSADEVQRVAAAGLPRAEAAVRERFPDANAVRANGSQFSHDLWRWRRLADLSGGATADSSFPPIREFVEARLTENALVVAEIIALAAGWGGEPYTPGLDMHSPMERHNTLARIANPADILLVAEGVIRRREAHLATWPHLLDGFVAPERQVLATLAARLQDSDVVVTSEDGGNDLHEQPDNDEA